MVCTFQCSNRALRRGNQITRPTSLETSQNRSTGLVVMSQTPRKIEKAKKEICKVFAENGLRVTIEANKKVVDFLDVTLDLNTGKYKPYSKPS